MLMLKYAQEAQGLRSSQPGIEAWAAVAIGAVGASAIGAIGSAISGGEQASAAETAAGDQEQAALDQLGLSSATFNAQGGLNLPTREAGGLAQSREAYLLGLTPNLDISPDFSTPNIQTNPSTGQTTSSWNGPANFDPSVSGTGYGSTSGYGGMSGGMSGGSPGTYGGWPDFEYSPPTAGMTRGLSAGPGTGVSGSTLVNGGAPNPNASEPKSAYGSFSNPYNASTFYLDPSYKFILGQNEQAVQNQAAQQGNAYSPAALAAAMQYSSGLASTEFGAAYNRSIQTQDNTFNMLNALSSGGQVATSGLTSAATAAGAQGASALAGYGNAGAAGAIGTGNAISSGINGITNAGQAYALSNAYNNNALNAAGETTGQQWEANYMLPGTNSMIQNDAQYNGLATMNPFSS